MNSNLIKPTIVEMMVVLMILSKAIFLSIWRINRKNLLNLTSFGLESSMWFEQCGLINVVWSMWFDQCGLNNVVWTRFLILMIFDGFNKCYDFLPFLSKRFLMSRNYWYHHLMLLKPRHVLPWSKLNVKLFFRIRLILNILIWVHIFDHLYP